jgi:hypothetical protein
MTTDERLDRLVERHEALTQSSELLTHSVESLARSMHHFHATSTGCADLLMTLPKVLLGSCARQSCTRIGSTITKID